MSHFTNICQFISLAVSLKVSNGSVPGLCLQHWFTTQDEVESGTPRECGPLTVRLTKILLLVMKMGPTGRHRSSSHSNELGSYPSLLRRPYRLLEEVLCMHIRKSTTESRAHSLRLQGFSRWLPPPTPTPICQALCL